MDIFEQFQVTVYQTVRARGGYICETDKGVRLLREYNGREEGLKKQAYITDLLCQAGMECDSFVRTTEGTLVAQDEDYKTYYMKQWFDGRECDTTSTREIVEAVRLLARLHRTLGTLVIEPEMTNEMRDVTVTFKRHIKELTSARNYLRSKRKKNRFENMVFESIDYYMEKAARSGELLLEKCSELPPQKMCHGSFNHHNVIFCRNGCAAVNFARAGRGCQVTDLYDFMRKMLEKYDWDIKLGMRLFEEYENIRPLSSGEQRLLAVLMLFPEKYWKIVNHYYNSNKAWFSDKDMEKLLKVKKQEEARNFFLEKFAYNIGLW